MPAGCGLFSSNTTSVGSSLMTDAVLPPCDPRVSSPLLFPLSAITAAAPIPIPKSTEKNAVRRSRRNRGVGDKKPNSALGGLPGKMRVEADPDIGVSAMTVGELRKVTAWPENLVIVTPHERYAGSAVKVSKASAATRVSPKR
jgi:hypothetical protein